MKPQRVSIPEVSVVAPALHNAYYADAYAVADPAPQLGSMETCLHVLRATPDWVERAMDLRNAVVSRLGLKNLGRLGGFDTHKPAADYRVGDAVGIFSLQHVGNDEVVMGDSDRHLDVCVSVFKSVADRQLVISTVVHVKNWFGRLYMLPVTPAHQIIVPAMLKKLSSRFSS
ncbi:DUF2867 domain-containing protein [Diaphorobacter caeni]|uniref:DUF2867 domain-containing protein n=1 Tax=Diaphorobacter caeni TaxID=2784387 RepID=UPI00188FD794|nr:DUF2867 domain-containing protein [Diaphorobacter caeni]MBF5004412.1 DUF2867 domain-containing protein [Diaphorobacter caeni]